jgi:aminopeptidase
MTSGGSRVEQYAELLVGRSLGVEPGWQVMVVATPLARPLVEELVRAIARRGAFPLVRLSFTDREQVPLEALWASEAPAELLPTLAPIEAQAREQLDAWLLVFSPENIYDGSELATERRLALRKAYRSFDRRKSTGEVPWVGCPFPTQALAQEAGLTIRGYEDVLYDACLRDWDAERERMRRYAERFDAAQLVQIVAPGTDISLSIAGRTGEIDDAHRNMPGGEFWYSPLEDSAEGVIEFSEFPASYGGHRCEGVRLRFETGRVVDASARSDEEFLLAILDADEGARRLGELGIGCNTGIPRHVRHMWFDEKVDGTIHLAIGQGFPAIGGVNESSIHWDMVKDLSHGRIELDGETVQENGEWLI